MHNISVKNDTKNIFMKSFLLSIAFVALSKFCLPGMKAKMALRVDWSSFS